MAIQCGFFDSVDGDRTYRADDMTKPYENLISNGVFATQQGTPSDYLQVVENISRLTVKVKPGKGIFKNKWFVSDESVILAVDSSEVGGLNRIDSVVVRINTSENVRSGTIAIKKGTAASSPVAPTMERSNNIHEYRLADVFVRSGATSIFVSNITDQRGSADCPWVTSLVQQVDTSTLLAQWQSAYNNYYEESTAMFENWFDDIHETVATQTLIRTFTSWYVTREDDETVIPINISQFNSELDILQVYINGLTMVENLDYTVDSNPSENITLTRPLAVGQVVSFIVYKSVDGSEAETVVGQVFDLQNLVQLVKPTSDTGSTKWTVSAGASVLTRFIQAGRGFHTWYAPASALDMPEANTCRMFGHLTAQSVGSEAGWIIALAVTGRVYANYLNNGAWVGWAELTNTSGMVTGAGRVKASVTSGDLLTSFKGLGVGFHTILAGDRVTNLPKSGQYYRCFGHITDLPYGWIIAIGADGKAWVNFSNGATTWTGWNELTNTNDMVSGSGGAKLSITDTSKNVLTEFTTLGTGAHTVYTASGVQGGPKTGAFRYMGHLTSANNGWIMAFGADGSIFSNYIVGGAWKGWKTVYDVTNAPLWTGQNFMNDGANIVPSKKLSECAHGWVLLWADYDDATSTANKFNAVTQVIPKLNATGDEWDNRSFMCVLPTVVNTDGTYSMTVKQVYVSDDHITGYAGNNVGALNRGVVLRAIYEY